MAFTKTLNVWDPVIRSALDAGTLRPQPAQWVRCGADNDHAALWVGMNRKSGTIYIAHWQGSMAATRERYHTLKAAVAGRL
jgi:hypothetical protein